MSRLTKLLAPGAVELQGGVEHWREAIRLAGGLLEKLWQCHGGVPI